MDETLKQELKSSIDESIKENLETIVGKEVATQVEKKVEEVRLSKALGNDLVGLTNDDKKAFAEDIKAIASGEKAAYLEGSDQAGGYVVPQELHDGIMRIAETTGIVARDAFRLPMSTDTLDVPKYTGSVMQGEYVGEDEEGDETQNDLGNVRLSAKQWMTIFRLSNALLADANVNLADWLLAMAGEGLAYRMDREGFVGGSYAGSPFVGLLASDQVTTQTLTTGKTGFEDLDVLEAAIAIGTIKTAALPGSAFHFSPSVWAQISSQKSGDMYVFNQDNTFLASLMKENGISPVGMIKGYPVYTTDVLPAYSASGTSTKFGVFGNLKQALMIGDRGPIEIAKSTDATVGGKSLFRANQTGLRMTHRHAVAVGLGAAAVVFKTAAG